jgi:hypothetical protein
MNTPKARARRAGCGKESQRHENESVRLIYRFRHSPASEENLFLDCEIHFPVRGQVQGTFWNFLETSRGKSLDINPDAVQ